MKRLFTFLIIAALLLLPTLAVAQAPAGAPASTPAQPEHPATPPAATQATPAPAQPQAAPQPCQPGPGGTCPMMTPEQMKQMQGKMGQCCMQAGQGSPRCQQLQKQLDDLQKRVEALEGKTKGKKK